MTATTVTGSSVIAARGLTISLDNGQAEPPAIVYELDLEVRPGECVGLVGESGSGKSLTGLAMMNLLPSGVGVAAGSLDFEGRDLVSLSEKELRRLRGKKISMVFQDPSSALNPSRTIGKQLMDIVRTHERLTRAEAKARAIEALSDVGFPDPAGRLNAFPFQLSGGLKQRVSIAMALVCRPSLVIADEPTTNLDVSVQAGILKLFRDRIDNDGFACVFVSHDLGVIGAVADRVQVMYAGQIVESGPVHAVLSNPQHPYTRGLIAAAPTMSSTREHPLMPHTGRRPSLSPTRPPSQMELVGGNGHYVRRDTVPLNTPDNRGGVL